MKRHIDIFEKIEKFGLEKVSHSNGHLLNHLRGVYDILIGWQESDTVALAGLFHSIYGTDAFNRASVSIESRNEIREIIGTEAERLAFIFCSMKRETLWSNLEKNHSFSIESRFDQSTIPLSERDIKDLFAIALANNLELRPREPWRQKAVNKAIYSRSRKFLSPVAYEAFQTGYRIKRNIKKKILILGGTLYIGKHLVYRLLNDGYEVVIASRGQVRDSFGANVERITLDRQNPLSFKSALEGKEWHAVYDNLCFTPEDAASACEVFSGQTSRYFMISSQAVYRSWGSPAENDFNPFTYRWDPSSPSAARPINNGKIYTNSAIPNWIGYDELKRRAEAVIATKMRAKSTMIRFPMVVGYDDPTFRLRHEVERILRHEVIEVYEKNCDIAILGVEEAARFLHWLLEAEIDGPINAASRGKFNADWILGLLAEIGRFNPQIQKKSNPTTPSLLARNTDALMNCGKAESKGFIFSQTENWIPPLLRAFAAPPAGSHQLIPILNSNK